MSKMTDSGSAPFCCAPCLSVSLPEIKREELYSKYFKKKSQRNYIEQATHKFIENNRRALEFLGIDALTSGVDERFCLKFTTSNYIGAVPTIMPYNGKPGGDIQIYPRFSDRQTAFAKISDLLTVLDYSIEPEFMDSLPLQNNDMFRPPLYFDAVKYIDMFESQLNRSWNKFKSIKRNNNYPKPSTEWNKYAAGSANPKNKLIYPSRDNILSPIHPEWQQLRYVFGLAAKEIASYSTPRKIRLQYSTKISKIRNRIYNVSSRYTQEIKIHISDTLAIKLLKEQANIILTQKSTVSTGLRIDVAILFERFVQYVVAETVKGLGGCVHSNIKISGTGSMPLWGLHYLEPDIVIEIDDLIIAADAKYKANFYSYHNNSDTLRETHRNDLHQILAYCSFEPHKNKTGILFYPADKFGYKQISYSDHIGTTANSVFLTGIPFEVESINDIKIQLSQMINSIITNSNNNM